MPPHFVHRSVQYSDDRPGMMRNTTRSASHCGQLDSTAGAGEADLVSDSGMGAPSFKSAQAADRSPRGNSATVAYRLSRSWSIWNFASDTAASALAQAKPTSSAENDTPSMTTGSRSVRMIRACHRPVPASKASIVNPSYSYRMAWTPELEAQPTTEGGKRM